MCQERIFRKMPHWIIFNLPYYVYVVYIAIYNSHTHVLSLSKERKLSLFFIVKSLIGIHSMQA